MNEKIFKLYELAKRGVGGEKVNAEKILQRMLKDAGLTMADLQRDEYPIRQRELKCAGGADFKQLLMQILFCVLNKDEITHYKTRRRSVVMVDLTDLQYAEVILRWNIYSAALKKEKAILLRAFFAKHDIHSNLPLKKPSTLTEKERQAILSKMRTMDDIVIPRQLNGHLLEQQG